MDERERIFRLRLSDLLFFLSPVFGIALSLWLPHQPPFDRWIEPEFDLYFRIGVFILTIAFLGFLVGLIGGRALIITYEDQQDEAKRQAPKERKNKN